ncbi:MAG: integration host factor subunit alpha [Nitrospirae bacterium]|nr:integration host factor subunit alpha [Nitrospirota bacterium]MBI3593483.1 integration host factor subunit alpha [Nitrospirota bacterium]
MRKADITTELFEKIGVSKKEGAEILEIILSTVKDVLKKGEVVKIAGFGNFVVRQKKERKGRNPKTGQEIGITPRKVVTFRPSQVFKKYVNDPANITKNEESDTILKGEQDNNITL